MKTTCLFVLALSLFTVLAGCTAETDPTPETTSGDRTTSEQREPEQQAPAVDVDEVEPRFTCCYEAPCGLRPPCRKPFEGP